MNGRILFMLSFNFILLGFLILRFVRYHKRGDARFDVFSIEENSLSMNSLSVPFTKHRYELSEIKLIELRKITPYMAGIRVIRIDGEKEREHYFDASFYYRKSTFRKKVDPAIEKIERDLAAAGLSYQIVEKSENERFL